MGKSQFQSAILNPDLLLLKPALIGYDPISYAAMGNGRSLSYVLW